MGSTITDRHIIAAAQEQLSIKPLLMREGHEGSALLTTAASGPVGWICPPPTTEGVLAMDVDTVDREFATLQQKAQQTSSLIQALAGKLSAAATGDANAREWQLDLKEIALAIREEEDTATSLLQAIHALVDNHVQSMASAPAAQPDYQQPPAYPQPPTYQQPAYAQPQYQPAGYGQAGGGTLGRFLSGNFGRAIVTGAGFGIGDDIINSIFR
jgi:hypothetical protein